MEFTTAENNVKVVINPASFADAFRLKTEIQKALLDNKININEAMDEDLVSIILAIDSSEKVTDALFSCLVISTFNGIKITRDTFEPEEARYDLYEIFFYCIKVNVYPFFKNLLSRLSINFQTPLKEEDQKSE